MRIDKLLLTCFAVTSAFFASAIDFSRTNISWQYDPMAEIKLSHRVIQNGDSLTIYLKFLHEKETSWKMEYSVQSDYESEFDVSLSDFEMDTLSAKPGKMILKLSFARPDENLLVAKISKDGVSFYYDILLKNGMLPFPSIFPKNEEGLPIFENYLNTSNFSWEGGNNLHAFAYAENFELADPPMGEMKALAPSLLPDTSFQLSRSDQLTDNFFYVIRENENASTGVTVLKMSPYYPELKLLNELSFAMQYILNEPEKKGIRNTRNLKSSFDSFWIKTYASKFQARNAIRNYYNWVELANRLFTDFKQGWKTDRGMIYIVFGAPDEVYRNNSEEEWFYDKGPAFEYAILSTFFAPRTYALRRSLSLQESWFESIAAIRRGTK